MDAPLSIKAATETAPKGYIIAFVAAAAAFLSFSTMDAIIRYLGQAIPAMQLSFLQRLFCTILYIVPLSFICIQKKSFAVFRINYIYSHLLRGVMVFFITIAFVNTFIHLPLSNAYSIVFSLPLFTVIFGRIFIKETISTLRLLAIIAGFIGIIIILRPGLGSISVGYFYALLGVGLEAPMFIIIRHYHKKDHPLNIAFYPSVFALFIFILYELTFKSSFAVEMNRTELLFIVLLSSLTICAQLFLNYSLKRLKAGLSISMQFTQILWGTLFGYFIFKDTYYDLPYIAGTIIIIYCSIVVTLNRLPFIRLRIRRKNSMNATLNTEQ